MCELRAALEREWMYDAMGVMYVGDGFEKQPRVNKSGLQWAETRYGLKLWTGVLMADVDNPGHGEWTAELRKAFEDRWTARGVLDTCGVYHTPHGYRLVQPMVTRVRSGEVERWIDAWYRELSEAGIAVDGNTRDWTRHFRMPHVRRGGASSVRRSAWMDLNRMAPRVITPRVWVAVPGASEVGTKPARPKIDRVERETSGWAPISDWIREGKIVGEAIRAHGTGGETHHMVYMALAGTLLQVGMKPSRVVSAVRSVAWGAMAMHADQHVKSAEDTLRRAESGLRYIGGEWLIRKVPFVADAVARACGGEVVMPPSPAESGEKMRAIIRDAGHGLVVMNGECGLGKTHAAIDVACERARVGEKTSISVNSNALARQIEEDVRARGLSVRRAFGPLSVEGTDECIYRKRALPMVSGGQNLRTIFCAPHGQKCERYETCKIKDGVTGDDDAKIIVGTHWLIGSLSEEAGVSGLLIVDEPPNALDDIAIAKTDIGTLRQRKDSFAAGYVDAMLEVIDALTSEGQSYSREIPREIRAAGPWQEDMSGWQTPPLKGSVKEIVRLRGDDDAGRASGVLKHVWRAIHSEQKVLWRVDRGGPEVAHGGGISLVLEHKKLRDVLNRAGGCVVMDANADSNIAIYRRLVGDEGVGVVGFAASDGCVVERTHATMGKTTRTNWIRGGAIQESVVKKALEAFAGWVRLNDRGGVYGLITYAPIEAMIRAGLGDLVSWREVWGDPERLAVVAKREIGFLRKRLVTMHYGATRGFNSLRDAEGLATLGDPWPNLVGVADELNYWSLPTWEYDSRQILMCKAELEQAQGRLRAVQRSATSMPIRALHLGSVRPGGWGWTFGSIQEVDAAQGVFQLQTTRNTGA